MKELSRDITTSFPSKFFPEVKALLSEFMDYYRPIEGLELWDAFPDWPLPKKLYEDCFKYPDKEFYWKYEREGANPGTQSGLEIAEMNRILLERLSEKLGAKISGNTVLGWRAHRAKFRHVELWTRHREEMKEELLEKGVRVTGSFYYPPGGYREWHTNANNRACWTMYYVRVSENQKSWFHYVNPTTDQLVQVPDIDDYFHLFYIADWEQVKAGNRPEFFWHNVVSHTHRRSLGLRVSEEIVSTIMERLAAKKNNP